MLDKMNQSLWTKENKKREGHTKLFPARYGCHLTNEEFITEQETDEREKREQLSQKTQRKEEREAKRSCRLEADAEWKMMLDGHAKAVSKWEELNEKLKAKNI